ncbi:MAG: type II toxin-antitoxin system VapC family toxin [Dysgonamonadaceae bacterium]|jgi:PIN domain nuclease of toxin-antitoxin system|nr:type II toxin-antitoxin system VapC family toxin [Dysgonamonadaceae bacterium]
MIRYLLDTNAMLSLYDKPERMNKEIQDIIDYFYYGRHYISTVSIMEIIHLYKRNKIRTIWKNAEDIIPDLISKFEILSVKTAHLLTYSRLICPPGHNDPNDHLIISQAISEKITLISSDSKFEHYVKQNLDFIFCDF